MRTLFFTAASGLVLGLSLIAGIAALKPATPAVKTRVAATTALPISEPPPAEPDRVLGGYSGTQFERELVMAQQRETEPKKPDADSPQRNRPLAPAKTKTGWTPPAGVWRWRQEATRDQFPDIAKRLSICADYAQSLQLVAGLAGKPRTVWQSRSVGGETRMEYLGEATRFAMMPGELAAVLFEAFNVARGCARQNLIFHVAQALPREYWRPWLNALWRGPDAEDSEDALCALAFLGEPEAQDDFAQLARQPAPVNSNRIVDTYEEHDALAKAGERAYLRSYRCIETLDGAPYFAQHRFASGHVAGKFPWCDRLTGSDALVERLLPLWLARYPGHPGGDDMAFRLSVLALRQGRNVDALNWASCCATWPDQDLVRSGTALMLFVAECAVTRAELQAVLSRALPRNRNLLSYVWLRRTALELGCNSALALLRELAEREPRLDVSRAHAACWAEDPCEGVDSGLEPLAQDDPLKQKSGSSIEWGNYSNPASLYHYRPRYVLKDGEKWREGLLYRHAPPDEAVEMEPRRLARQFRCWETIAELQLRQSDPAPPPDLAYKIAAIRYHNAAFVPCYVHEYHYHSGLPDERFAFRQDDLLSAYRDYCRKAARFADAAASFDALWPSELNADLRAKALYSAGLSWIHAADTRAPIGTDRQECIRTGVERFEQLARELPQSTLADAAADAARYWRRNYARLWGEASVSGK